MRHVADNSSEVLDRKLDISRLWAGTLETVLQQQLASTAFANDSASTRTASDLGGDVVQEFIAFSDYHDGRDIFEAANIMTIVRLAMYWTHRGVDALACVEKTKSPPIQAYANILKAGWILQRLQLDQRARSEECSAVVVSLSEVRACHFRFDSPASNILINLVIGRSFRIEKN